MWYGAIPTSRDTHLGEGVSIGNNTIRTCQREKCSIIKDIT